MVRITHKFVSGKGQGPDPSKVYGPQWDDDHIVEGLENVDNTSDLDKPVSNAVQDALDGKIDGPVEDLPFIPGSTTAGVSTPDNPLNVQRNGDNLFFGHTTSSYKSSLGAEVSNGTPFVALDAEAGTTDNTYKTNGLKGSIIKPDNAGGFEFHTLANANADNQTPTIIGRLTPDGNFFSRGSNGSGVVVNIKDPIYGVKGDGTDESVKLQQAADMAVSKNGSLYFPPGTYRGTINVLEEGYLRIFCDSPGSATLRAYTAGQPALSLRSDVSSGVSAVHLSVQNMTLMSQAAQANSDVVLQVKNVGFISLTDVIVWGQTAFDGTGYGYIANVFCQGNPGLHIGNLGDTIANTGPLVFVGCHLKGYSGGAALEIQGDPLAVSFIACDYGAGPCEASITIDGPSSGIPHGSVSFFECHGESNYSSANTGADILIGNTYKAGTVRFYGGSFWGNGNNTNYHAYWCRVVAARGIIVDGARLSSQGHTGFSSAGIRFDASFPASGDIYSIRMPDAAITGLRISDGNSVIPPYTGFASNEDSYAIARFGRGHIIGLTLSTAGSSTTFSVAAGEAVDKLGTDLMVLKSAISKTTSAWAVGSGNGGLDTGSIANSTWYHVHLIKRQNTGVVDVLFSLSATAPTLPGFYLLSRRIGSIKTTSGGNWTKFVQDGDNFIWDVPVTDVNATNPGTSAVLYPLSVPPGVSVLANIHTRTAMSSTSSCATLVTSPMIADSSPGVTNAQHWGTSGFSPSTSLRVRTDTSQQIRVRLSASAADVTSVVVTEGWDDSRGKSA